MKNQEQWQTTEEHLLFHQEFLLLMVGRSNGENIKGSSIYTSILYFGLFQCSAFQNVSFSFGKSETERSVPATHQIHSHHS